MRCFVAIDLPPAITDELSKLTDRLRQTGARASWVPPERMHLTLRFLGEIQDEQCRRIDLLLQQRLPRRQALALWIGGAGTFGKKKRPDVVWVGVKIESGDIAAVLSTLDEAADAIGVAPDPRPFRPHITLARIREPRTAEALALAVETESAFVAGQFTCHNVTLYRSKLSPQGPEYSIIRKYPICVA